MSASVLRCNSVEVSDQMIAVMFVKNYRSLELCVKGQELVHKIGELRHSLLSVAIECHWCSRMLHRKSCVVYV